MSYFPTLLNLNNKKVLVVGAGEIAYRKIKFFLEFTNEITIVSQEKTKKVQDLIDANQLQFFQENIELKKIEKFDVVVATLNNLTIQEEIYNYTRDKKILYSCVDFPQYCDFIFPSYIKREDLIVTISTNGKAPALAKQLKLYLEKFIPSSIGKKIEQMYKIRKNEQKGENRMEKLKQIAEDYIKGISN